MSELRLICAVSRVFLIQIKHLWPEVVNHVSA
jgi:hypothetical protein